MDNPQLKSDIISSLQQVWEEVESFCKEIEEEAFQKRPTEGKWSAAENFYHLILSSQPLASALKMPKLTFKAFGKPNRPVRTYDELVKRYHEKLSQGGTAPSGYSPKEKDLSDRESLLEDWITTGEQIRKRLDEKWTEEELDKYLMPHPLLGKIFAREMMFFTIYHSLHHLKIMKERAS